jgi:hypothetical protein
VCLLRTPFATGDKEGAGLRRSTGAVMLGRIIRVGIIIGILIITGVSSAQAQTPAINVDFSFVAGGKTLSAGNWIVDIGSDCKVVLTHEKGGDPVEMAAIKTVSRSVQRAELVFEVVGSAKFLSEVYLPGKGGCVVSRQPGALERETVKGPKPTK